MKKKTLGIIIVSVLGAAAIFCSAMFTHQYLDAKSSKAAFDDLTNLITEIDEPQKDTEAEAESNLSAEELAAAEAAPSSMVSSHFWPAALMASSVYSTAIS
mgnify:CR=1 FL=1